MGLRSSAEYRSNKKGRRTEPQRKRTSVLGGASEPHRLSRSRRKIPDRNHSKGNTRSRTVPSDFPHKSRFRIAGRAFRRKFFVRVNPMPARPRSSTSPNESFPAAPTPDRGGTKY